MQRCQALQAVGCGTPSPCIGQGIAPHRRSGFECRRLATRRFAAQVKSTRILANQCGQCPCECRADRKHHPRISRCQRRHRIAPLFGGARSRKCGLDRVRVLKHHQLASVADGLRRHRVNRPMPAEPLDATRPLVYRPNLDVGRQQITGRAAGGDVQPQARQFAPHVGTVAFEQFQRHGPLVPDVVVIKPFEKPTPLPALAVSRFGDHSQWGTHPHGRLLVALMVGPGE